MVKKGVNNMIGDIRKFRFWCQKVLPLVYDDSLSYYEILCKVVQYLNKVIEDVNSIPDYIDAVIDEKLTDEHLQELIEEFVLNIESAISSNNEGNNTNSSADYNIGQMLWWNGKLYRVIRQIDAGDTFIVDTNIALVNFEDLFNDFVDEVKHDITSNDDGGSPTATQSWTTGTWLWLNDVLYIVKSDITEGNAYVFSGDNANVEQITVEEMIGGLDERVGSLDDLTTTDKTSIVNAINSEMQAREDTDASLRDDIDAEVLARETSDGDLSELTTDDKSSLVAAINEVNSTGGGAVAMIGDLDDLTTTNKDNVVSAINELNASKKIKYVDTTTALSSASLSIGDVVYTKGYYAVDDGGGALFHIKSESTRFNIPLTGMVAELVYDSEINILQAGAHGDGVTDDYAVLNNVLTYANAFIPNHGGSQYLISDSIHMARYKHIRGDILNGADYPTITFSAGGFFMDNSYTTIEGLTIVTNNESNAIQISDVDLTVSNIIIKNCIINGSQTGITSQGVSFLIDIDNIRFINCINGMWLYNAVFNVLVKNCYFNMCSGRLMSLYNSVAKVLNCNFGFNTLSTVNSSGYGSYEFDNCHFESDVLSTSALLFYFDGKHTSFNNCDFLIGASNAACYTIAATCDSVIMTNCKYQVMSASASTMPITGSMVMPKYGAFVIGDGCDGIPTPALTNALLPYIKRGNSPIQFNGTTIDKALLEKGQLAYQASSNTMCYYNGTNVVNLTTGSVIV